MKKLLKLMIAAGIVMLVVAICIESDNIAVGGVVMIIASVIFLSFEQGIKP